MNSRADGLITIKIGGGLLGTPGAFDTVCTGVGALGRVRRVVVVPGGGPFADAVRAFDQHIGLSAGAAHWMAILGMDQYAQALAERIPGATLVDDLAGILPAVDTGGVAVLAPYKWMRAADVLPHSWDVTSDSVAAFIAGAVDAIHLVLVKPSSAPQEECVDPFFRSVLPAGLPCTVVRWDHIAELATVL